MTTEIDLRHLESLAVGWDGEDAPPPNAVALLLAQNAITVLLAAGITPYEIDADVLGGVAVWYHSPDGSRKVWVAAMNSGRASVLCERGGVVTASMSDDIAPDVARFITMGVRPCS